MGDGKGRMPWTDLAPMDQRLELVTLARSGEFTVIELDLRFSVSRKTTHQWISRYEVGGAGTGRAGANSGMGNIKKCCLTPYAESGPVGSNAFEGDWFMTF